MTIRVMSGRAYVDLDPALQRWVDSAVRRAAPETLAKLEETGEELYADAYDKWPVKTGKSKSLLFWHVRLKNLTRIELVIGCDADYSFYITEPWPSKKRPWRELLLKPTKKAYSRLSDELREHLATKLQPGGI